MIAFCGLVCDTCPIHLATLEPEKSHQQKMRESIAQICSEQYGMNLKSGDINDCDGCRADSGILFSGCSECRVRKCAALKEIENCAMCCNYSCETLEEHFTHDPECRMRLEVIRRTAENNRFS